MQACTFLLIFFASLFFQQIFYEYFFRRLIFYWLLYYIQLCMDNTLQSFQWEIYTRKLWSEIFLRPFFPRPCVAWSSILWQYYFFCVLCLHTCPKHSISPPTPPPSLSHHLLSPSDFELIKIENKISCLSGLENHMRSFLVY
jgi:hypothetical protein